MKKTLTITLLLLTLIACQDGSRVENLHKQIEEPIREETQTLLEEKFPTNTYAVATQKRVYFHSEPDNAYKLESFIISGQFCTVEKVKNDFGYVSFVYKNKTTTGWLNLNDLEPYGLHIEGQTDKSTDLKFSLNISNKREAPAESIDFLADYKIELKDGGVSIAVFKDIGHGWLSDEKDFVSIRTGMPSERTYSFEKGENDEVTVIQHFFFSEMDIDEDTWRKTYKKDLHNNWKLINCRGECD